jgi:hypothetical protein
MLSDFYRSKNAFKSDILKEKKNLTAFSFEMAQQFKSKHFFAIPLKSEIL